MMTSSPYVVTNERRGRPKSLLHLGTKILTLAASLDGMSIHSPGARLRALSAHSKCRLFLGGGVFEWISTTSIFISVRQAYDYALS